MIDTEHVGLQYPVTLSHINSFSKKKLSTFPVKFMGLAMQQHEF